VRGLNALAGVISTPLSAPVIGAARLRGGNAPSGRGAASLAKEIIGTARECGCTGLLIVRLDSGFYSAAVISAIRSAGARFSVTVPMNSSIRAAIAAIGEDAWTPIRYPRAIWDDQLQAWVSDAEVTETGYTAFASKKDQQVTARLIVRRVRDQNEKAARGQGELFPAWRYHAVLTDSPFETAQAEGHHRDHAIVEQVFADWYNGPVAHLPSGSFNANATWLVIAAMTHNLVRDRGTRRPPAREGPHRDHPPRPHHRRRPHRPPRPRPSHPPPARSLAPRAGMAQSLGRRLRPAAHSGLTSPDRSAPTPKRPPAPDPAQDPVDTPQNRQRQAEHAQKQIVEARTHNRRTRHSTGRVGLGRGTRIAPGPFPQAARRTRRAHY
jgi:Transposase DDE domain group 1